MRQQFVLQATFLTHEDGMSSLEVIKQIIGLTWLQYRVDISMFPVHENLGRVDERYFDLKSAKRIELAIIARLPVNVEKRS